MKCKSIIIALVLFFPHWLNAGQADSSYLVKTQVTELGFGNPLYKYTFLSPMHYKGPSIALQRTNYQNAFHGTLITRYAAYVAMTENDIKSNQTLLVNTKFDVQYLFHFSYLEQWGIKSKAGLTYDILFNTGMNYGNVNNITAPVLTTNLGLAAMFSYHFKFLGLPFGFINHFSLPVTGFFMAPEYASSIPYSLREKEANYSLLYPSSFKNYYAPDNQFIFEFPIYNLISHKFSNWRLTWHYQFLYLNHSNNQLFVRSNTLMIGRVFKLYN